MQTTESITEVKKTVLSNGLKIVTENIPGVKSITAGFWVKTGSRHESDKLAGVTHFLEHMLFKGTEKRSSYDIAQSMESVGGYLNAFTSTEYTCYYSRCLDTQIDKAMDVLSDMIQNSQFPEEELQKEKKVVLEEMKMYKDSPDDYIFELFSGNVFKDHQVGRPIIGFEETVSSFTRQNLFDYMDNRYRPDNMLIAVAGHVDHDEVISLIQEKLELKNSEPTVDEEQPLTSYDKFQIEESRVIEQTHMVMGRRALNYDHPDKYLLLLANTVLGGGMSSRLHQNIREKYGYCYAIGTFNQSYTDTGMFGVYIGTDKNYVSHVRDLISKEFEIIQNDKVGEKELSEAKSQLKGKLLLSQESTSNRMNRLAKSELYFNRFVTLDELVENIDSVTAGDLLTFSQNFFDADQFSEALLTPENR
ncbi:M16 family metallopeptidase [Rhodohalobacter barkolensis]|uniref:Insulinase family protein n=1 Tax=Rhodohalobacter barkolensis TaxID=2053187 RepID=A0A2N0VJS5_9BACT|nr:pitrilysin family protein [Rhodohalobacter barkolensis]PKD44404.1 insulinase family protein [Rhodohalobacter barkolensis]